MKIIAFAILFPLFLTLTTCVSGKIINGFLKNEEDHILITYCSAQYSYGRSSSSNTAEEGLASPTEYIIHGDVSSSTCGNQLTMDFKSDGNVTFRINEGPTAGDYFCPAFESSHDPNIYLTHHTYPCDFSYIYTPNSVWQETYRLGYNGHALIFSKQATKDAGYCSNVRSAGFVTIDK